MTKKPRSRKSLIVYIIIAVVLAVTSMLVVGGIVGRLSGRGVVFSAVAARWPRGRHLRSSTYTVPHVHV